MADLKNQLITRCQFCQLSRVLRIFRDRLLNQQMFAATQQRKRNLVVRACRRRDRRRVHQFGEFLKRLGRSHAVFFCNRTRSRKIDIVNGGKVRGRNLGIEPRMIAPDMADADDANARSFHLATFFKNHS